MRSQDRRIGQIMMGRSQRHASCDAPHRTYACRRAHRTPSHMRIVRAIADVAKDDERAYLLCGSDRLTACGDGAFNTARTLHRAIELAVPACIVQHETSHLHRTVPGKGFSQSVLASAHDLRTPRRAVTRSPNGRVLTLRAIARSRSARVAWARGGYRCGQRSADTTEHDSIRNLETHAGANRGWRELSRSEIY
jgi:hypothetical protein